VLRLTEALQQQNLLDRTLLVITSDHGEGLGEHGEMAHGMLLHDATQRVPLILRHPQLPAARVSDRIVTLADLLPTILEFVGQPLPANADGRSLLQLQADSTSHSEAYLETLNPQLSYSWAPLYGVRNREWKLVWGARPHLYDLGQDPNEQQECAADHPEVVEDLSRRILALRSRGPAIDSATRQITGAELELLGGLGYVAMEAQQPIEESAHLPDPHDHMQSKDRLERGLHLLETDRAAEAVEILEPLATELPETFLIRKALGAAYGRNGQHSLALSEFQAAARLHPGSVDIHVQLALAAGKSGQSELAREHLHQAVEMPGCAPRAFFMLAQNYRKASQLRRAREVLKTLLEQPNLPAGARQQAEQLLGR
jgi:tetratricopeptide (TPR) repeat protein